MKSNSFHRPNHIAIIMDGNGRWAVEKGMSRARGHSAGAANAERMIKHAVKRGVPVLSLFAFSTENWKRPVSETAVIMWLLNSYLKRAGRFFHEHGVRFDYVGDLTPLPASTAVALETLKHQTSQFEGTSVVLAINYSGQQDILRAANALARQSSAASTLPTSLTQAMFEAELQTAPHGPVDLLIRTGREKRLSNFFLWQTAYAELQFSDKLWPDFTAEDFDSSLNAFCKADRRFGGLNRSKVQGF